MKKLLMMILTVCMILTLAVPAFATETEPVRNVCGEDMTWEYADGAVNIAAVIKARAAVAAVFQILPIAYLKRCFLDEKSLKPRLTCTP